jgi:hypothetical protein
MHVVLCIYMPPHLIVAASIWRATRLQVTDTSHACCFVHLHATRPHCGCFNLACNTITGDRHKPCVLFCAFTCCNLACNTITHTSHCFVLYIHCGYFNLACNTITGDTHHAFCFVHLHATTPHCGCFNLACNTITGDRHKPCMLFCAFTCHQTSLWLLQSGVQHDYR